MNKSRNERGWALVSVLCVVSMLALMAAATQELTITSSRAERANAQFRDDARKQGILPGWLR